MAQLVGACPSCAASLEVRRLECPACGVTVEGHFEPGPLSRLSREEIAFVETFLRARGKIKDVEEELGISYPTVVSRLNDVLVSMGFETPEQDPADFRRKVLDDLAAGRVTAAEATEQLRALGGVDGR